LEDNDPPLPPVNLTGRVDSSGIATIAWQANTESDIAGYRVFRANALRDEFVEVTRQPVVEAVYRDTISLNTLTHGIFYKLTAVDRRYNNSGYSDPVRLTRPDTIAPAPAIFTDIAEKDGEVKMTWEESPSDDVAAVTLYRTAEYDSIKMKVQEWTPKTLPAQYTDRLTVGGHYIYTLETRDEAGNISKNSRKCYSDVATALQVQLNARREGKGVALTWQLPKEPKVKMVTIYRAAEGEPLTTLTSTAGGNSTMDIDAEAGTSYQYKIKVAFVNGQIAFSETIKIEK
jgi:hypothetical protein